uniref:Uncharacterized protein n=1 Tax=Clastoptera arizonana TaxID=38151 RepID=A0A1B6BYN3_9HEMI
MIPEGLIFWSLSVCVLITIVAVLFGCICGCRKTIPKNELMGLAGMVKITNPDENVNFNIPPAVVQLNPSPIVIAADDLVNEAGEVNKRQSNTLASATRSLPDLPVETDRGIIQNPTPLWETVEGNGDTSSDLYATVEDNKNEFSRSAGKKNNVSRTVDSSYGSPSQTDDSLSPYARVKGEHPYDQVKQNEHPYAQVGDKGKVGQNCIQKEATQSTSSRNVMCEDVELGDSPIAPPRTRKSISLSQSSLVSHSVDSILAATAIAGGIPANQELPYMTPPLPANQQPQHFSGDSQDSSKGYTSISVREPLASIRGEVNRRKELVDSHYATVSDDSDEMYAAIDDPNQSNYTSGSETYAQIKPRETMPSELPTTQNVVVHMENQSSNLHTPQSHNLNNVKNAHSRQESSSSAASSLVSPNSPKPEKRQANSPLPRPPDPGNPAVDEMYAKVFKKRRSSQSVSSLDPEVTDSLPLLESGLPGYETVEACHTTVLNEKCSQYGETVIPNYETVSGNNPDNDLDRLCSGYETLSGEHDSLIPGYERVSGGKEQGSDSEPNYEELRPQNGGNACGESSYATINKKRKISDAREEPDYASLSRKDFGYETVDGFDPNYESVCRAEPNYESVEKQEPPYEKVISNSVELYETVTKQNHSYKRSDEDIYSQVNKPRTDR